MNNNTDMHMQGDAALWMQGLLRYKSCGYVRPPSHYPVIWQKGQVQCYQVHQHHKLDAPTMLWIPSLINRYYILDMNHELSLLQFLAAQGINVYVIDWHHPLPVYAQMRTEQYMLQFLAPLVDELSAIHAQSIHLAGYCIGGMMALAYAQLHPEYVASLCLIATPWDFSHMKAITQNPLCANVVQRALDMPTPLLHGAYINWLFYLMDTEKFKQKYADFALMELGSPAYQRFIEVEYWVNDCVSLTRAFAEQCLVDWVQDNHTMRGKWNINQQIISPEKIACPAFIVAPENDMIVPPKTVHPLAKLIPNAQIITPNAGHIGMMVGKNRHHALWHPLCEFVKACRS
jgi:polyhydroxyalkanoate synthase subunit PhaC